MSSRRTPRPGDGRHGPAATAKAAALALALAAGALAVVLLATGRSRTRAVADVVHCTRTLEPGTGAGAIAAAIVSAPDGSSICLAGGRYPPVRVAGATHTAFVTVTPAPGATATVAGIEVADSSYLRFEGLHMTEGFNMRDGPTYPGSHDYQFIDNTFEEPLYGIVLGGGRGPIKRVLIEGNYMHRAHLAQPEVHGHCDAGYAEGQDVTIFYAEGVTISHNVFKEAAWHYIQGGGAGPEGIDVEHNLFEGHELLACSHLNIWQIWNGGFHDTFRDNLALGEGTGEREGRTEEASTDGLIFENGPGSAKCGVTMQATVVENNLFVDAASSYAIQIYSTDGAAIEDNTVVRSQYGSGLLVTKCPPSADSEMTHNIDVENTGHAADFTFVCAGACAYDDNVSSDATAGKLGAAHALTGWKPSWISSTWDPASEASPPAGYYVASGLPFAAGYRGGGGP